MGFDPVVLLLSRGSVWCYASRMQKRTVSVLFLLCGLGPAHDALLAADKPTLALVGGQVIDGYEGPPIHDGVVLIAGERIVAVGRRGEVAVPAGTPVIDTAGMSVLPGLMDMHVHLMILGHADYEHWDTTYMSRFRDEIMPIAAKQLLMSGVTTVRDLGAPLEDILHVQAAHREGRDPGAAALRLGPLHPAPAVLRVREVRALGRRRPRGRARQGAEAGGRRASTSSS